MRAEVEGVIEQFWLFHCGYVGVPEGVIVDGAPMRGTRRLPFLAALAFHSELGPILVDAPFGHEGSRNMGVIYGALLQRTAQVFKPSWSIIPRIEQLGWRASEVNHILMTHLHFDHTGGMKELGHARFHLDQAEWSYASKLSRVGGLLNGYAVGDWRALGSRIEKLSLPAYFDREDSGHDVFGDGSVFAHPLPGHSPGHTGYRFVLPEGREIFFVGDAAFTVPQITEGKGLGRFPTTFGADVHRATMTLHELREFHAENRDVELVSAHDFDWGERCLQGPIQIGGPTSE